MVFSYAFPFTGTSLMFLTEHEDSLVKLNVLNCALLFFFVYSAYADETLHFRERR